MLKDTTIQRDSVNHNLAKRIIDKVRKKIAPSRRKKLDEYYRRTLAGVEFSVLSNNCVGGYFCMMQENNFVPLQLI